MSIRKLSDSENLLGRNIQKTRKLQGLKQYELAARLDTSPGYISEIESGKKIPGSEFLFSLKQLLGVNLDGLFEEKTDYIAAQKEGVAVNEPSSDYHSVDLMLKILEEKSDIIRLLQDQIKDLKTDKKMFESLMIDQKEQITELKKRLNNPDEDK